MSMSIPVLKQCGSLVQLESCDKGGKGKAREKWLIAWVLTQ